MNDDMTRAFENLQKMQDELQKAQIELRSVTSTAEVGGGMVKVTANGLQEVVSIKIEKEVIDPAEAEMLEDLIVTAVNQALKKAKESGGSHMDSIARSFLASIPGTPFNRGEA